MRGGSANCILWIAGRDRFSRCKCSAGPKARGLLRSAREQIPFVPRRPRENDAAVKSARSFIVTSRKRLAAMIRLELDVGHHYEDSG